MCAGPATRPGGSRSTTSIPERDVRFTMGPVDVLDHSSRAFTYGSKMGIDAHAEVARRGFDASGRSGS